MKEMVQSEDHKPDGEGERKRIKEAGGFVQGGAGGGDENEEGGIGSFLPSYMPGEC